MTSVMSVGNVQLGFFNRDGSDFLGSEADTREFPLKGSAPKPKYVVFHPKDIKELYPEKIFERMVA